MDTQLQALQRNFQAYLMGDAANTLLANIEGSGKRFQLKRVGIYADAYLLRLLEALSKDFSQLFRLMGQINFSRMGKLYLEAHPSRYFSVRYLGTDLADFLATTKPYCEQSIWTELAKFEWALRETIDAQDVLLLTTADLMSLPQDSWSEMRIVLHSSVSLLDLNWDIPALWRNAQLPKVSSAKLLKDALPLAATWIVWRKELQAYYDRVTPEEAWALRAFQRGESFSEVCQGLCEWLPEEEVAQRTVQMLMRWLQHGLLSEARVF